MKIINYDSESETIAKSKKGDPLKLPKQLRCIICGPAGCGKTNLTLNLICNDGWLEYEGLYVCSKTLFQSKYERLRQAFEETCPEVAVFCSSMEEIPLPEQLTDGKKTVFIFDDCMVEKQDKIERYFAYGRHANVNVLYLCQTYSRIPKRVIRDNSNVLILFRQDDTNLKHVYNNHVGCDMSFEEFKQMCGECWNSDSHGFLTIDKTKSLRDGRYRNMLD